MGSSRPQTTSCGAPPGMAGTQPLLPRTSRPDTSSTWRSTTVRSRPHPGVCAAASPFSASAPPLRPSRRLISTLIQLRYMYIHSCHPATVSDGSWGAGGDGFPYLWKKKGAADSGGNDAPLNAPPSTCTSEPPTHNMDTTGATVSNHENVASWEDCRSLCCSDPTCGV